MVRSISSLVFHSVQRWSLTDGKPGPDRESKFENWGVYHGVYGGEPECGPGMGPSKVGRILDGAAIGRGMN